MTDREESEIIEDARGASALLGAMILASVAVLAFGLGWFASAVLR